MEKRTSEWVKGVQQPDGGWFFYGLPAGGDVEDFEDREVDGVPEKRAVYRAQNAREIMAEEADAAIEPDELTREENEGWAEGWAEDYSDPQHNDGMSQEERQARYDEAMDDLRRRQDDERELQRLEERRQYRQFVAGQVYPALVNQVEGLEDAQRFADAAVALADELIAALDRAEALDGASETEQ